MERDLMDIDEDLLVHEVIVEKLTLSGYADPVGVAAFVVDASPPDNDARVITHLDETDRFTLDSKVTLPSGVIAYVVKIIWNDDGGLGAPSHLELRLGSARGEADDALLDLGTLSRPSKPAFDKITGNLTPAENHYWSGPSSAEPVTSAAAATEMGDQQVGVQEFIVSVPLEVVDIRRGDLYRTTSSADPRLLTRTLVVIKVEAGTDATVRRFRAIDNQGGG